MTPLFLATLLCIFACAFFAGASPLGKAVLTVIPGSSLHRFQVTAARFLFAFITLAPFLIMGGGAVYFARRYLLDICSAWFWDWSG